MVTVGGYQDSIQWNTVYETSQVLHQKLYNRGKKSCTIDWNTTLWYCKVRTEWIIILSQCKVKKTVENRCGYCRKSAPKTHTTFITTPSLGRKKKEMRRVRGTQEDSHERNLLKLLTSRSTSYQSDLQIVNIQYSEQSDRSLQLLPQPLRHREAGIWRHHAVMMPSRPRHALLIYARTHIHSHSQPRVYSG